MCTYIYIYIYICVHIYYIICYSIKFVHKGTLTLTKTNKSELEINAASV